MTGSPIGAKTPQTPGPSVDLEKGCLCWIRSSSDSTANQKNPYGLSLVLRDRRPEILQIASELEAQGRDTGRRSELRDGLLNKLMLSAMAFTMWQFIALPFVARAAVCASFGECPSNHRSKFPPSVFSTTPVPTTTTRAEAPGDHFEAAYYILTLVGVVFLIALLGFYVGKYAYDLKYPPVPIIPSREDKILEVGKNLTKDELEGFFKAPFVVDANALMIPVREKLNQQDAQKVMEIPVHGRGSDLYLKLSPRDMRFSIHSVPKGDINYGQPEQPDGEGEKSYHRVDWVDVGEHAAFAEFYRDLMNLYSRLASSESQDPKNSGEIGDRVKKFLNALFKDGVFLNVWQNDTKTMQVVFCENAAHISDLVIGEIMLSFEVS